MEYGIKVNGAWMHFISEYHNNRQITTFKSKEEAKVYAEGLEIPNYVIEEYNASIASR
jgi:hypothetical protein